MARRALLLVLLAAILLPATGRAFEAPPGAATRLQGLTPDEAQALIGQLEAAQAGLKQGSTVNFVLLSGAPASYAQAGIAPRDAFLQASFARPFSITRLSPDGAERRSYRILLLPNGPRQIVCDVGVEFGFNGQIERIQLFYGPPAPF